MIWRWDIVEETESMWVLPIIDVVENTECVMYNCHSFSK